MIILNKKNRTTTSIKFGNGIPYISFNALEQTGMVVNAFSTRQGGVSVGCLESMNLGFNRGDLDENVLKNHKIFAKAVGFPYENIVTTNQTHTTNVRVVTKEDCGKGIAKDRDYSDVDGLITNIPGIVLATYYADCVPLYILDPINKAIGLSHSGWKGTVKRIGDNTLKLMNENYGTNPKDVICCIGPSICQDCYEISEDVANEFINEFGKNNKILYNKGNGKYQLNLWESVKQVFLDAGVEYDNIYTTDICTCCNKDELFSHRGHHGKRGNLAAFLMLK
ncbi:peptidoglycan editing factor PgeF [uncultured Eubacterium sp.]|jgi:YfiH family protein|uniref:peptidoglycan editing factor PgeF n=1 Tax=uncultured Eubacterium sp. TaxID=165185 RepID=UPI0026DA74CB|nr:peptidoglycan editing factor PgeF [uncultured Eubacterium sp.]